jgi:hypothetical protein
LAINTTSFYAIAAAAAAGFNTIRDGAPKLFIYTGNMCNTLIVPEQPGLGAGKNAPAHLIEIAANVYKSKHNWYYADERLPNGRPTMSAVDWEAYGEAYFELAEHKEQGPRNYTFVKGAGYKKFAAEVDREFTPIADLMAEIKKWGDLCGHHGEIRAVVSESPY